jgi:hypothetical protein
MSRATCRGTRTRGVGEVVDDEPARGEVFDDKPRDEPRDMPRHPIARRRQSRFVAAARRVVTTHNGIDRAHDESQCDRLTRSRALRRRIRMHDIGAVEPVQSGRRVVASRDAVTGRTARARATDQQEVERRDGASGCTA